jgi:23S rRNA (cytosine1962-C5)-methyltransferase
MGTALRLNKGADRRLRSGHCWVYSNEVDTKATPLAGLEPGAPVEVVDHDGRWLGHGYANPHSLICARVVSRDRAHPLDRSLLVHRLNIALASRERLFESRCYRLVYGEADGLPGLIVDRYAEHLVVQFTTAGMERARAAVIEALERVLRPRGILLRNDSASRGREGLERYVEVASGEVPAELEVRERGAVFGVDPFGGQKTGWFYDQAANRDALGHHVGERRVLDVFSYAGAWGVRAALQGAQSVTCVDASHAALEAVAANAHRNGVAERVQTLRGDAFAVLRELRAAGERFDVVVLDPPAFVKRKKDLREGTLAYRRINEAALGLLERDGILVSASCSHHMGRDGLLKTVQQAARHLNRSLQLLREGHQGPDHPVHPAIPETAYLKAFFLRVLPGF